jgi:competence protein ComEC
MAIKQVPNLSIGLIVLGGLWLCIWRKSWRVHGLLAIFLGGILAINAPVPDIFVSAKGNLIGVTLPSGDLATSKLRGGRFEREVWMRIAGSKRSIAWENLRPEDGASTLCDALGCTYRNENNEVIAYAENYAALEEDCRRAKYLVSKVPLSNHLCVNPILVIDRFDLWLKGAHTIRFTESGPRVESVRAINGRRPWVQWRKSPQQAD